MQIWVDADAVPGDIKDIIVRASERLQIPTVFVANKDIRTQRSRFVSTVRVSQGPDVADSYIAQSAQGGDLAVTQDIPLAAILVEKGVVVIDVRGELLTEANVRERLSIRDFMQGMRDSGVVTSGPRAFDQRAKQKFAATFDSALAKLTRKNRP